MARRSVTDQPGPRTNRIGGVCRACYKTPSACYRLNDRQIIRIGTSEHVGDFGRRAVAQRTLARRSRRQKGANATQDLNVRASGIKQSKRMGVASVINAITLGAKSGQHAWTIHNDHLD